jgi:superfamily I DNA/RNA helicase
LYRNHFFRLQIETQLIKLGLPYKIEGKNLGYCDSQEFRALKIFLSLKNEKLKSYDLTEKQTKVMSKFFFSKYKNSDINTVLLNDWETVFNFEYKKKKYLKSLVKLNKDLKFNYSIKLNTIHGAKGKEAERVIVINSLGNKFSRFSKQKKETEIRVFYVALTRTKNRLDIVNGDNSFRLINKCGII